MLKHSAALPLTRGALRILIVLNWLSGAAILALLIWSTTHERWTFTALGVPPSPETRPLIIGMRVIAALGLVAIPLNHAVLGRVRAMVETVRTGDPFVAANAHRLQAIAWVLLALQLLSLVIGGIGKAISTPAHPLHLDAGFSLSGWLAVVLTFVLARVFAQGTLMRDDLEGTV
ncbi:MAG TPA: DUF2975 domain-containing protein [Gemmatimonadales bacterium]|jgi:hypothetical protein|nr:DUF2975 domain-containing protein [Gemmatimonadales bacterium]